MSMSRREAFADVSNRRANPKTTSIATSPIPKSKALSSPSIPSSFAEQQALLEQESQRVEEAKRFLSIQRATLIDRKAKLKSARRNWKQDVLEAKSKGATAGSKQASILRKIQKVLDQQAEGLEQDELVLRDSEHWLRVKEARVEKLAEDLELQGNCDLSALSIDTQQLMAPLREGITSTPSKPSRSALKHEQDHGSKSKNSKEHRSHSAGHRHSHRSDSPTPIGMSTALERIENRLDVMAGLIGPSAKAAALLPPPPSSARPSDAVPKTKTSSSTRRRRSTSATNRHVGFAAAYPTGAPTVW